MPIEFLGMARPNRGDETHLNTGEHFDQAYFTRLARVHEDGGFDRVLFAYASGGRDPATSAAWFAAKFDRLGILLAHRPNVSNPTFAAQQFATLDQLSNGRLAVHIITGGSQKDQIRDGDTLPKDRRYARSREYIQILKRAWTETEPFSHEGEFYRFEDFLARVRPVQSPRPRISFAGASQEAIDVGGAEADVFALWGEPLAGTRAQIDAVLEAARKVGRAEDNLPKIQTFFRFVIAPTDELAWKRADELIARAGALRAAQPVDPRARPINPENEGSQRLLRQGAPGTRHDRAGLVHATTEASGGGNAIAIVGSPETIAEALLDYYDIGVRIFHVRGFDTFNDSVDFGRHVIPLLRSEVARRESEENRPLRLEA